MQKILLNGGIKILNSLKIIDFISFGTETYDFDLLKKCANLLYEEPKEYKTLLTDELNKGSSYPKAREIAIKSYLKDNDISKILSTPNNILGIEYLKALKKTNSKIKPISIQRSGNKYNDTDITGNMASATAIRNIIKDDGFNILRNVLPESSYSTIMNNIKSGHLVYDLSTFEKQIIYNLRKMSISQIAELPDVSEGLEFAIKNAANSSANLQELLELLNTKRYTSTRIQRILLYSLLGITKKDMEISKKNTPYIRVLGFNERGKYLLSEISKANPRLKIVTSVKKFMDNNFNKNLKVMMEKDIFATDVFTLGYEYNSCSNLDYTHKLIFNGDGPF